MQSCRHNHPRRLAPHAAQLCANTPGLECTRSSSEPFSRSIAGEGGSVIGTLTITEDDEPADAIRAFCQAHGQPAAFERAMVQSVCALGRVLCSRTTAARAKAYSKVGGRWTTTLAGCLRWLVGGQHSGRHSGDRRTRGVAV